MLTLVGEMRLSLISLMVSVDVNDHERRGRGKVSVSLMHWPGTWGKVNIVLNVHRRLIRDGKRRGKREIIYYRYTVTTGMTPALRWAAMRAIFMFH